MIRKLFFVLMSALILFPACKSGKTTLEKGRYYEAVMQSVKRLRKNPDHRNAKLTLHDGYPLAKQYHEDIAKRLKSGSDPYKWEKVVDQYRLLDNLYKEIQRCPSCINLAKSSRSYSREVDEAGLKAAETRYALGDRAMAVHTRTSARDAFFHFQTAESFRPNFRDARKRMEEARFHATLKIIVERIPIHSQALKISNNFFQDKINEYLLAHKFNDFVRFYTPREAIQTNLEQPDHTVMLNFDDFIIGQHYVKETVEKVSRDSVVIGRSGKGDNPIYGTVTAEIRTFRKNVESKGLLDLKIMDNRTQRLLVTDKLAGTHVWYCEWGSFNGDERALTREQLAICKKRELMPPPPQDLFIEFTKPIYDQVTRKISTFYNNY